jgi:hypothetical protein
VFGGLSGTKRERLILKGFPRYSPQHEFNENGTPIHLKSLAIPAGFEPATHGVEIRSGYNDINDLVALCTIGVPSGPKKSQLDAFRRALVSFVVHEQVAVGVERHLD